MIKDKIFYLTIMSSSWCNFRCVYCFENNYFKKEYIITSGDITSRIKLFLNKTLERKTFNKIHVTWYGGEPLLDYKTIIDIMDYITNLSKKYNVKISSDILTNGYLLDLYKFTELLKRNVKIFQITIDGWRDTHDKLRPLLNNRPTFDRIFNNLLQTKSVNDDFIMIVRSNVTKSNIDSIKRFLNFISSYLSNDKRYYFTFFIVKKSGSINDDKLDYIEYEKRDLVLEDLYNYAINLGLNVLNNTLLYQLGSIPTKYGLCGAVYPYSITIRNDGKIFKCPMTVLLDSEAIGYLDEDGSLIIDEEKINRWAKYINTKIGCPRLFELGDA